MSSSDSQSVGGLAVDTYYQIRNTYDIQFAAMALTVYDIVITFDNEVALIWKRQWNIASLAYLVNRYFVLIQSVLNIVTFLDPSLSPGACTSLNIYADIWSIPIIVTIIEALLVLRVGALFGNRRVVTMALWMLLVSSFISTAILAGIVSKAIVPIASPVPSVTGCFFANSDAGQRLFSFIWIPSLVVEITLVTLTISKTIQHVRSAIKTPVLTIVMRDGCLYFIAIFALMLLNAVFYGLPVQTGAYEAAFLEPELCISSVLCSRLFLNLRGVLRAKDASEITPERPGPGEEHEMGEMENALEGSTMVASSDTD